VPHKSTTFANGAKKPLQVYRPRINLRRMYTPLAEHMPMFPPGDDTDALKRAFAVALCRNPNEPYQAARQIEPNAGRASYIAAYWPGDPLVMSHMEKVSVDQGAAAFLPTKEEFAKRVLDASQEITRHDVKLDYMKLFAAVMGYVEKPSDRPNVNVAIVNKVMAVPRYPNKEDARHAIAAQQAKLINAASA
jgi:hypothetical protein